MAAYHGVVTTLPYIEMMAKLLSWEETLEGLNGIYMQKNRVELPHIMKEALYRMKERADCSEEGARRLKEFCKAKTKEVKMFNIAIPEFILPPGYKGTLHDIKVNTNGPDDKIYNKNLDVRQMVPRGTTVMQLDTPESSLDVIVYANKKFTGGMGDEDDAQPQNDEVWREYCLEAPESAEEIVCMEKLNGDAAHFSGRFINEQFYVFSGSKNTHLMLKTKSNIDMYEGEGFNRYLLARVFSRTVCDAFEKIDSNLLNLLFNLLHHTKVTAVCEVLQPEAQHIVDISYLDENQLNFITFTPTIAHMEETTLTAFPPNHALDLMKAIGFHCCEYSIIQPKEMYEWKNKVRAQRYKEGEVLYYLNKKGETFGLAKGKCAWYVILRAIRTKATGLFPPTKKRKGDIENTIKSTRTRLDDIQNWLKLSNVCKEEWMKLAESYLRWLEKELACNRISASDIRPKYPVIWKKFLQDTNLDDVIPL